mgnify:CR=1 FL=1
MKDQELKCCISGSYGKFKPEIDRTIEEFNDHGITVLQPVKGWLLIPKGMIYRVNKNNFRPLPSERYMTVRQIEDSFLNDVSISNFLYVDNHEGHFGTSACLEIGFAVARDIPVFFRQKPTTLIELEIEIDKSIIASPSEIRGLLANSGE